MSAEQNKRKHPASDEDEDPTTNRAEPEEAIAGPSSAPDRPPPLPSDAATTKIEKPPPIELPQGRNYMKAVKIARENGIQISASGTPDTRVFTKTPDDFRKLRKLFEQNEIEYHTFSLKDEKKLKVVLRGVPETITDEEMSSDLATKGYKFESVKRLRNKHKTFPLVLVNTERTEEGKKLLNCPDVLHAKISVEPKRRPTTQSQCYRCQRFGHVQRHCTAAYRCVKCAAFHPTWECTLANNARPKCCHCGGPHPSSYRECEENPDHKKRIAHEKREAAKAAVAEKRRQNVDKTTKPNVIFADATKNKEINTTALAKLCGDGNEPLQQRLQAVVQGLSLLKQILSYV